MSDTSVDNGATEDVASSSVAPSARTGEQPGSTPAPAEPAAPLDEAKADEAEKQSRAEARRFATLRRENRELYRRLGGLEAMLRQQQPTNEGEKTPQQAPSKPSDAAQEELNRSILESIEDAGEEYEAVVEKILAPNFHISVAMRDYLATSEKTPQLAKLLTDDPKEARRISLLGDRAADRAMEQLEARLAGAAKTAPRTTRAPAPVRTVGGSSTATADPSKMSMEAYAEWRSKRPS